MKLLRKNKEPDAGPTVYVGDHTDKLMRIRPIFHDEDERQSREDLHYCESLFERSPAPRRGATWRSASPR